MEDDLQDHLIHVMQNVYSQEMRDMLNSITANVNQQTGIYSAGTSNSWSGWGDSLTTVTNRIITNALDDTYLEQSLQDPYPKIYVDEYYGSPSSPKYRKKAQWKTEQNRFKKSRS